MTRDDNIEHLVFLWFPISFGVRGPTGWSNLRTVFLATARTAPPERTGYPSHEPKL